MTRIVSIMALLGWGFSMALAQPTIYVSPDVATDPDGPATYLPWQVVEHVSGGPAFYALELTLAGDPALNALHKMDRPGDWLFSVEALDDLGGALETEPRDVVRLSGGLPGTFFDGSCVLPPLPAESDIDALFLLEDAGNLFVSFEAPTTIGATTFSPSEIVEWVRMAPGPCGWSLLGSAIDLQAPPTTDYFPSSARITGADRVGDQFILALDVPVDVAPSTGPETILTGQIAVFDPATGAWDLFEDLLTQGAPGWPISSQVDALSCQANPGRIDAASSPAQQIRLDKSLPEIQIVCPASCSSGGEFYGVFQGTLASLQSGVYDHVQTSCLGVCPGTLNVTPPPGTGTYYLVVPHNAKEEGSYGTDSNLVERPRPVLVADRCAAAQRITSCP